MYVVRQIHLQCGGAQHITVVWKEYPHNQSLLRLSPRYRMTIIHDVDLTDLTDESRAKYVFHRARWLSTIYCVLL